MLGLSATATAPKGKIMSYSEGNQYRAIDRHVAYVRPDRNAPWKAVTIRAGVQGKNLLKVVERLNRLHGWQKYAYAQMTEGGPSLLAG